MRLAFIKDNRKSTSLLLARLFYPLALSIILFIAGCATIQAKRIYVPPPDYISTENDLKVTFIDVGQGDSIYIRTPNGKHIIVDGGGVPSWKSGVDTGYEYVIPYLKKNIRGKVVLDAVIMSHPHADHVGGLVTILQNLHVKKVYDSGYQIGDEEYARCLEVIKAKNIPYEIICEGDTLNIDPDLAIKVFGPPADFQYEGANNNSIIMKLIYKEFSMLLTGDAEAELENYVASKYGSQLRANVLKSPHHGSRTSSTSGFIGYVKPEVAVISCGRNNQFNHPHTETLSRYRNYDCQVFRTDYDGNVTITSNGYSFTVTTSK